jgi:hypothetical protein
MMGLDGIRNWLRGGLALIASVILAATIALAVPAPRRRPARL